MEIRGIFYITLEFDTDALDKETFNTTKNTMQLQFDSNNNSVSIINESNYVSLLAGQSYNLITDYTNLPNIVKVTVEFKDNSYTAYDTNDTNDTNDVNIVILDTYVPKLDTLD